MEKSQSTALSSMGLAIIYIYISRLAPYLFIIFIDPFLGLVSSKREKREGKKEKKKKKVKRRENRAEI